MLLQDLLFAECGAQDGLEVAGRGAGRLEGALERALGRGWGQVSPVGLLHLDAGVGFVARGAVVEIAEAHVGGLRLGRVVVCGRIGEGGAGGLERRVHGSGFGEAGGPGRLERSGERVGRRATTGCNGHCGNGFVVG